MQVSGRITEIVLRTDDKETGVKISFSLDQEQELELARLRGQALTFNIVPREQLKQGSLFEEAKPRVVHAGKAEHPWTPNMDDWKEGEQLQCTEGCGLPESAHMEMFNHFYGAPENVEAWEEVPDKCRHCGFGVRLHYQRPDHDWEEWTGLVTIGPNGQQALVTKCGHEGCEVPKHLHSNFYQGTPADEEGEPPADPEGQEPSEQVEDGDTSLAGHAYHSLPEVSDEVIHEERDLTDVPIIDLPSDAAPEAAASPAVAEVDPRFADYPNRPHTASDAAAEEGMRRRGRGRQSRGSDAPESEAGTFETEERPE